MCQVESCGSWVHHSKCHFGHDVIAQSMRRVNICSIRDHRFTTSRSAEIERFGHIVGQHELFSLAFLAHSRDDDLERA